MNTPALAFVLAAAASMAGCAANSDTSANEPRDQPEYRTGSNLPVRTVKPKTKEEREQAQRDAEQAQRDAEKILRPGT